MLPIYIIVHAVHIVHTNGDKAFDESNIKIAMNLGSVCYYYVNNDNTITFVLFNGDKVKTEETSDKIMDLMNESSARSLYT